MTDRFIVVSVTGFEIKQFGGGRCLTSYSVLDTKICYRAIRTFVPGRFVKGQYGGQKRCKRAAELLAAALNAECAAVPNG